MKNSVVIYLALFICTLGAAGLILPMGSSLQILLPHTLMAGVALGLGIALLAQQLTSRQIKPIWWLLLSVVLWLVGAKDFLYVGHEGFGAYVSHADLFVIVPAAIASLLIALDQWKSITFPTPLNRVYRHVEVLRAESYQQIKRQEQSLLPRLERAGIALVASVYDFFDTRLHHRQQN